MADAAWPLQQAVYAAASAAVAPVLVFDGAAPAGQPFPYIVFGTPTAIPAATKTEDGQQHTLTLHVWHDGTQPDGSIEGGSGPVMRLMAALRDALHEQPAALTMTGHRAVMATIEFQTAMVDPDQPAVTHGVLRLRVVTEPA